MAERKKLRLVRRTQCPGCGKLYANVESHYTQRPACKAVAYCEDADDSEGEQPAEEQEITEVLESFLDDAAACDVADGLAELKYERGFQAPDVAAAKRFAGVVGKRTRDHAFKLLQGCTIQDRDDFDTGVWFFHTVGLNTRRHGGPGGSTRLLPSQRK